MMSKLGLGEEPPKFTHANTVKSSSSILTPKTDLKNNDSSNFGKKKTQKAPNQGRSGQLSGLSHILRSGGAS